MMTDSPAATLLRPGPKRKTQSLEPPLGIQNATSVHTLQTSGRFSESHGDIQKFFQAPPTPGELRRGRYPNELAAAEAAYDAWDSAHDGDRYWRLLDCRTSWKYYWDSETLKVITAARACCLRWCPICAEAHAGFLSHQVRAWFEVAKAPSLLTLTLQHSDEQLLVQMVLLYQAWRKLRRAKFMQDAIRGGIWFLQITFNKEAGQWHPHLHALIDNDFIPQSRISQRWAKLTNGSTVVDIRRCYSPDAAAHHVARYATRPGTLSSVPEDRRLELVEALDNKRIVGTWGTAKSIALARPKAEDKANQIELGTWHEIHKKAQTSLAARAVILAEKTGLDVTANVVRQLHPQTEIDSPWLRDKHNCEYSHVDLFPP